MMADSAPKVAPEERQEAANTLDNKAQTLANQIKKSKHFIAFTGAGISTSAGIPDFRGPEGAWTLRAQGRERKGKTITTLEAIPTPTHMALSELQNRGLLKYLVSQNCDGLHRKSGIPKDRISELHGNSNRECCKDCGKDYIRDFRAVASFEKDIHDHRTGRKCARCGGQLYDTIVNFGEPLPAEALELAFENAKKADLCLVLGSSLMVTPANEIPEVTGRRKGAKLVICNLQKTPLDKLSELRVYSRTDELMIRVMEKLDIPMPKFILKRRLIVRMDMEDGRRQLKVAGVDEDGTPATFLRSVKLAFNRRKVLAEPFIFPFRGSLDEGTALTLELEFMGHYGEPNLEIIYEYQVGDDSENLYLLEYDPQTREWESTQQTNVPSSGEPHSIIDLISEDEDSNVAAVIGSTVL